MMDPLSGVASVIAVVQLAGGILTICGKYIKNVRNATQDIQEIEEKISSLAQVLQSLCELIQGSNGNRLATHELLSDLSRCSIVLQNLKAKIDPQTTQQGLRREWGIRAWKWPLKQSEVDSTIKELDWYRTTFSLSLQVDQMRSTNTVHQKIDLGALPHAKGAAFDSYDNKHNECLAGTRLDILQEIDQWSKSSDGKCIYWLNGMAGTGKSTISRTVAHRLKRQKLLGASFFFKRGEENRGTAKTLFPTLAKQLVASIPQILPGIQQSIKEDPDISDKALREQFDNLLLHPLLGVKGTERHEMRVIVIDALDECDSHEDIGVLLRLLPLIQKSTSVQIRFLLTSRPELPIRLGFKMIHDDHQDLILHEIERDVMVHDISLYFHDQFQQIRQVHALPPEWPGDASMQNLIDRAIPLFIAAATLCRFIGDSRWNPQKRLEAILTGGMTYASRMDGTYNPVLGQILCGQNDVDSQRLQAEFKDIVGAIIILATPLSIGSLSRLLDRDSADMKCCLDQLHSVLSVPDNFETPIRILHLSFRDFLVERRESSFWINEEHANQSLARQCLQLMQQSLRRNICSLPYDGMERKEISDDVIQQYLSPELKYACRYWVQHLIGCANQIHLIQDAFFFLHLHLLHWMEAMSLLGMVSDIPVLLNDLEMLLSLKEKNPASFDFIQDAKRFILKNRQIIGRAPLQVYCTGLVFAPRSAIVRGLFEDEMPTWMYQLPVSIDEEWGIELQTLEGHSEGLRSVAFSSDGRLLASSSRDGSICLWEPGLGALIQTLRAHSDVHSLSFSPKCIPLMLASGSADGNVLFWDPVVGLLLQTSKGHSGTVHTLAFSPTSPLLASGSADHTVRLWNPTSGAHIRTLSGHSATVASVAFSPNGILVASASYDTTVRVWDIAAGTAIQIFDNDQHMASSLAFSPDSNLFRRGSEEKRIYAEESATGRLMKAVHKFSPSIRSLAFSPDDHLLASSSTDNVVSIWSTNTGELLMSLKGHSRSINSLAFSPDGVLLASGSDDRTVRLRSLRLGAPSRNILEGHSQIAYSVTFSPDGRLVASTSLDKTVCLWNTKTGALMKILKGHSLSIDQVVFSPDSRLLVSIDATLRTWDVASGTLIQAVQDETYNFESVAFSPTDSHMLASGSDDGIMRLWNPVTGKLLKSFNDHLQDLDAGEQVQINSVAFSPSGRLLASGSFNNMIHIWDIQKGTLIKTLQGHSAWINSVTFSPDGQLLASSSGDCTVRLWDTVIGVLMHTCKVDKEVESIEFSQDGCYIHTIVGVIDVQKGFGVAKSHSSQIAIQDNRWIKLNGKKALWLPPEYRPYSFQIRGNTVAMGHASGRVSIMSFHVDKEDSERGYDCILGFSDLDG